VVAKTLNNVDYRVNNWITIDLLLHRSGERTVGLDLVPTGFQYTGRSLSLISVLGGILVILVILAFISCYKHRKRVSNDDILYRP
jgi:hypothetical protein